MNESPIKCQGNAAYDEDEDKPTLLKFVQLKEITNQTRESGHSSHDHCNRSEVLNPGKARPAQGSSRALFVLVIIVCLISLVALLLTLLMLVGKIGQCTGLLTLETTKCIITRQNFISGMLKWIIKQTHFDHIFKRVVKCFTVTSDSSKISSVTGDWNKIGPVTRDWTS